jgi:hypothetical protein
LGLVEWNRPTADVTLEALVCLEDDLRTPRNIPIADDLHCQVRILAHVADAWRRAHRDRCDQRLKATATWAAPGEGWARPNHSAARSRLKP